MKSMIAFAIFATFACWAPAAGTADNVAIEADVVYGHKDGLAMTFDVLKPKEHANRAGVLFMVSGGFTSKWSPPEDNVARFRTLLDKGFTVFIVRHGSNPKYLVPEIVDDVRRSVRFVRKNDARFDVDPQRLGVTGGSAGGYLAMMLGTTGDDGDPQAKDELLHTSDRVAAVVAYYPPVDVRPWVVPTSHHYKTFPAVRFDPSKADAYSPILAVTPDDPPTLIIYGDNDPYVPLEDSRKILAEFEKVKIASKLLVIKGGGHGFHGDDEERAAAARDAWFEKYLLKKEGG